MVSDVNLHPYIKVPQYNGYTVCPEGEVALDALCDKGATAFDDLDKARRYRLTSGLPWVLKALGFVNQL